MAVRPPQRPSFTLLRIAVGLTVLILATAFAAPRLRDAVLRSRAERTANDLRQFSTLLQAHAARVGDWPPGDGTPGAIPEGMAAILEPTGWRAPSPIGGRYTWDPHGVHQGLRHRAAIVIAGTADAAVSRDVRQLLALDRAFDDGDLATGHLQLGYRNFPLLILEH